MASATVPFPGSQTGAGDYLITPKKLTGAFSGQGEAGSIGALELNGTQTPEQLGIGCIQSTGLKKVPLSGGLAELGTPATSVAVSPSDQDVPCLPGLASATATATFPGGQEVDVTGASIWSASLDQSYGAGEFDCGSPGSTGTVTADFEGVSGSASLEFLENIQIAGVNLNGSVVLPDGTNGDPYSGSYDVAQGGTPPFTWAVVEGSLPPGLSLDPTTGAVTGTPTQAGGDYSWTIQVTDSSSPTPLVSTSNSGIESIDPMDGTVGLPYSQAYTPTAGAPPDTTWSVTEGSLAPGLSLDPSTGILSGTPTQAGNYSWSVQAESLSTDFIEVFNSGITIDPGM